MEDKDQPFSTGSSWEGCLVVLILAPLYLFLPRADQGGLATASLIAFGSILLSIRISWPLRKELWFWITMIVITIIHLVIILRVHWGNNYIPGPFLIPFVIADCTIILSIIYVLNIVILKAVRANSNPSRQRGD